MKMLNLLAMAPATPPGTEPNPQGQMLQMIGMFAILGVMFYFLLIRPQQKQRKEQENMIKNVKSGDRILTTGGVYGIVTNVKEKSLMLKIADNVKVEIAKSAIGSVIQKSAESESSSS
ncbi:MAG: preprotein translocase subunit YajC [Verrucomicrobiia bacterium]|jgi:preprotein translocase subunit YajC